MPELSISTKVRIRYCETDRMGFLHHSRHATFMEIGRSELLRKCGIPYKELEDAGYLFAISEMNVKYLSPIFYDEEITIRTILDKIGRASLKYRYEFTNQNGKAVCAASTTLACIDSSGKLQAVPAYVIEAHKKAMD